MHTIFPFLFYKRKRTDLGIFNSFVSMSSRSSFFICHRQMHCMGIVNKQYSFNLSKCRNEKQNDLL